MTKIISSTPRFCELLAFTNYSFLEGAAFPEAMVHTAHAVGYSALGIVDRNGFYGSARAHTAALGKHFKILHGARVLLREGIELALLCKNHQGYGDLSELLSRAHRREEDSLVKTVELEEVLESHLHLFILIPVRGLQSGHFTTLHTLRRTFEDRFYLAVSRWLDGSAWETQALHWAQDLQAPCIATNEPLFHLAEKKPLQDALTCIRHQCRIEEAGLRLEPNAERFLKTPEQMAALFREHPEWLENTQKIADACQFSLAELKYRYPVEWIPAGETVNGYLEKLVWAGGAKRFPHGIPDKVFRQIVHELNLIVELEYSDYFLTIWDIVEFAKSQGILCQGRGSAANSCVCFVLGVTSIDPMKMDLLFERFISRERREPPDIDIDFEHNRREEVIQYIYRRYGRERAAITATVISFRKRSAFRELGKVFSIPVTSIEKIQTLTHRRKLRDIPESEIRSVLPGIDPHRIELYLSLCSEIRAFPRHLGTHVGGFVLSQDKLTRNIPVQAAAMPDRTIVQWDKNDLDALGFVRVDILGLGILTCIRQCLEILKNTYNVHLALHTIPPEDPKVYEQIQAGDTIGLFQIESRAQMSMLPRLKPKTFYDLVIEISLVRPGPIQGQMVNPYLKRRMGTEPIDYAHPDLEPILKKTCGVPLFQEQIMTMAMQVAGFSGGEADQLRRAMGTWRRSEEGLHSLRDRFLEGLKQHGVSAIYAERVFSQIEGFAEYGFPESHAASFAILVYATAYLRHYYPDAYLTAILNAQPMGFYSKHTLIHDGERHGVQVLPIDVQYSTWDNCVERPGYMRLGFREIFGLSKTVGMAFQKKTMGEGFLKWVHAVQAELTEQKVALTKRDLFLLAGADALTGFGFSRREALWAVQSLDIPASHLLGETQEEQGVTFPLETKLEHLLLDYQAQGVSLVQHPMGLFRSILEEQEIPDSRALASLPNGKRMTVAGLVICRQMPPTAKGVVFLTLEDEFGFINLILWPAVFAQARETWLTSSFLQVTGKLQKSQGVVNLLAESGLPLNIEGEFKDRSRDFH